MKNKSYFPSFSCAMRGALMFFFIFCSAVISIASGAEKNQSHIENKMSDKNCLLLNKAANLALAQNAIHAVIRQDQGMGDVKTPSQTILMHSIVIGQSQYSNMMHPRFKKTTLENSDMRILASDIGAFFVEQGCHFLGQEKIAGKTASVLTASGDLGRGEIKMKFWIDAASGLPLRMTSDEPDFDIETHLNKVKNKENSKPQSSTKIQEKSNGKRILATHAYIFGELVKAPGVKGEISPSALSSLTSLLDAKP